VSRGRTFARRQSIGAAVLIASSALACSAEDPLPPAPNDDLAIGLRYLDDEAFRRSALEGALVNPNNIYSQDRLRNYAAGTRGWDLLPVWNPRAVPLSRELAEAIAQGRDPEVPRETAPLWGGVRPATREAWAALGREVFFRYPVRAEPIVAWALGQPELAERAGVSRAPDGSVLGLVVFVDLDGRSRVGITCAMCHANVRDGQLIVGEARRAFDYGSLRAAYDDATQNSDGVDVVSQLHAWGPGRVDITEDNDDPVAIPDLWGVRAESYLTQAGTIRHTGPAALAIRQETQYLTANREQARPPRELALALTFAIYSFVPPPSAQPADAQAQAGATLFAEHCQGCHSNAAYSGAPVAAATVDTDPALADGTARGTGHYRPASLLRVKNAAPYFHDGSVAKLEDVLAPERFEPTFTGGFLGPGAVRGHRFGTELALEQRRAIVAYLNTL
jgi:cytochrome c5